MLLGGKQPTGGVLKDRGMKKEGEKEQPSSNLQTSPYKPSQKRTQTKNANFEEARRTKTSLDRTEDKRGFRDASRPHKNMGTKENNNLGGLKNGEEAQHEGKPVVSHFWSHKRKMVPPRKFGSGVNSERKGVGGHGRRGNSDRLER